MIRMLVQLRRKVGMAREDFYRHWRITHADLVREAATFNGATRYVQSHRIASPEIDSFAATRGWGPPPDGLAELWWPDQRTMLRATQSAESLRLGQQIRADEMLFVDPAGLRGVMTCEELIFDHDNETPTRDGPTVKMIVEVWKRPDLSDDAFHARWRGAHADLARKVKKAMGFIRYVQSHRDRSFPIELSATRGWLPEPDGITEVWWSSESAMRAAFTSPEAAEASALLAADEQEFVDPTRSIAFLAEEHHIFG